jgi:hypothetical protein
MLLVIVNHAMISAFIDGFGFSYVNEEGKPMYFFQNIEDFRKEYEKDIHFNWFVSDNINIALKNTYTFLRSLKKQI